MSPLKISCEIHKKYVSFKLLINGSDTYKNTMKYKHKVENNYDTLFLCVCVYLYISQDFFFLQ